jgi:hypothetical protein
MFIRRLSCSSVSLYSVTVEARWLHDLTASDWLVDICWGYVKLKAAVGRQCSVCSKRSRDSSAELSKNGFCWSSLNTEGERTIGVVDAATFVVAL